MALSRIGKCCRSYMRESFKSVMTGVLPTTWTGRCIVAIAPPVTSSAQRHLLTDHVIRLQDFQQHKLASAVRVAGPQENFIELYNQKMQMTNLLLKDDLKLLLHLCQSVDDVMLARRAIMRYHSENRNVAYGEFRFGPLFMRLCYELGLEELAAATVIDESMRGFFDTTSCNIAMDMSFIKGSYENVLKILQTMRNQGLSLNRDSLMLACGTYYKMNTEEYFKICNALIEEEQSKGRDIPRLALCFLTSLAIRQNNIIKAKQVFEQIMNTNSRLCQHLKVLIMAMSGDMPGAILILSRAKVPTLTFVKRPEFSQEMLDVLRLLSKGGPYKQELEEVLSELEKNNQVTQQTIDDMLCHIPTPKRNEPFSVEKKRRTSRRTLRELSSSLYSE